MRVRAFLPEIHRRPTGGNLFNLHVLTFLDAFAEVDRRVVTDGESLPEPADGDEADVAVVDSLLLERVVDDRRSGAGRRILVAHYLEMFEQDTPRAANERKQLRLFDGVVTTSEFCRDLLVRDGWNSERVAAIMPGLGSAYFAEPPDRPPDSAAPRLLTVATVLEGKGLRGLLGVLEGLADLDWTWEIAGDPGLDPDFATVFRRRLAESPVEQRVRLLGAVEPAKMVAVYDRASHFVLPSRFETCSIATMEAMARGLPVVAHRVGGIPERLPPASRQMLVPVGDHEALATILRRLMTERAKSAALGRLNRDVARSFPTWDRCGEAFWRFVRSGHGRR